MYRLSTTSRNIDIESDAMNEIIKNANIKDFGSIEFHNNEEDVMVCFNPKIIFLIVSNH